MKTPPTQGYRVLLFGRDFPLLETRRLLLNRIGLRVISVTSIEQLRTAASQPRHPYRLMILCHTVEAEDREEAEALAQSLGMGLYQLERMEPPPRFVHTVSGMMPEE